MSPDTDLTAPEQPSVLPSILPAQPHDMDDGDTIGLSAPQSLNRSYFVPPQPGLGPLTPESFINVPFVNLPLYIPGLTQTVVGFDGGINKAALDVHRDQGLLCNLLPYLDMAERDFIELFCNDTLIPVAIYNVTKDDADKARIIPLYIPRTRLPDGPANPVFMRVTRVSGSSEETPRHHLTVDTVAPAGRNPIASTLQNENLPAPIFPQHIIDFGVTKTDAQNGVPVTFRFYPVDDTQPPSTYRAVRDRIRLRVGGENAPIPPLTESQAAGREDITFTLFYGFWQQVRSGSHVCEYEVVDEVGNPSQGWSPALLLNVELDDGAESRLPEAHFREAPDDILDHNELDGKDATIVIAIRGLGYNVGDEILVKVNGRAADGSPIVPPSLSVTLTSDTVREITVPFSNETVRSLIGGRLQLSYERIRSSPPNRQSKSTIVQVTGTPIETRLRPPTIIEAIDGVIDPQVLFVNIDVPVYAGRDRFDLVTLILDGMYANGSRYYREIDMTAGTGDIRFRINNGPNGEIARLEGGTLRVLYQVTNADGTRTSLDTQANVGNPMASLPEPEVKQAPAPMYQFDPAASTGDADVLVRSNASFQEDDTVTLYCEGTAPGGTALPQPFPIKRQWVGRDLPFVLERRYITPNLNQTMRIFYTHTPVTGSTRFSHAVNMRVGSRLVLNAPTVLEATDLGDNVARLNPLHVLPPRPAEVTVRVVSDSFPPGSDIKVHIIGKPGVGTPDIPAKPSTPEPGGNYVSFTVPSDFVGAYLGGECKVFYNLLEIGKTSQSDELTLRVEALAAQEWDLVSVPQALGGVIDVSKPASVRIDAWPFFASGRNARIELDGSSSNGPHHLVLRNNRPVSAEEFNQGFLSVAIPEDYLDELLDTSELVVRAWVSTDGLNSIPPNQALIELRLHVSANATGRPVFANGPYTLTPQGRIHVQLRLNDSTGNPVPNGKLSLELPTGFTFADGGSGERVFVTDNNGQVSVEVKGSNTVGSSTLIARSGTQTAAAAVNVIANGTDGSVGIYYPRHVVLNPEGTRAYVSAYTSGIHVVNTLTNSQINLIPLDYPGEIAMSPDGTYLFVGHNQGLYIINLLLQQVTHLVVDHHSDLTGLAVAPNGKTVCLTIQAGNLAIMDTTTHEVSFVAVSANPTGLVITGDSRYAVVGGPELTVIDIQNKVVVKKAFRTATSLAINNTNDNIYICVYGSDQLYEYDINRNEVTDLVKLDHTYNYYIDISPDGERLYLSAGAVVRHLTVVDTVQRKQLANKPGDDGARVAVSPDNLRMFVTNIRSNTLASQPAR